MFRPGSAYVSKDAKTVLGKVAKIMAAKPALEILVEGHTDTALSLQTVSRTTGS